MKKAKYEVYQIVRYGDGPTALMQVEDIVAVRGQHRYYGPQFYGGTIGSYELDLMPATDAEVHRFKTDNHLNRLSDRNEKSKAKIQKAR